MKLNVDFSGGQLLNADSNAHPVMFHGTEWGSCVKIVGMSQGFIVGESRCGGKAGLWCGRSLSFAVQRANPDRYMYRGDYSRWSPVVLELQSLELQKRGSQKYLVPGDNFQRLDGILLRKVHLNKMSMMNCMMLECPHLRNRLTFDSFKVRRCACRLCAQCCVPEDHAEHW